MLKALRILLGIIVNTQTKCIAIMSFYIYEETNSVIPNVTKILRTELRFEPSSGLFIYSLIQQAFSVYPLSCYWNTIHQGLLHFSTSCKCDISGFLF